MENRNAPPDIEWATDMTYSENLWLYFTLLFGIIIVPGMDMLLSLIHI